MKERIYAAILSTLIFSLVFAALGYSPEAASYEEFSSLFYLAAIFSLPAYLIGGIASSILIDKMISQAFLNFLAYLLAGFIVGFLTIAISLQSLHFSLVYFGLFGLFASSIFYGLHRMFKSIKGNK